MMYVHIFFSNSQLIITNYKKPENSLIIYNIICNERELQSSDVVRIWCSSFKTKWKEDAIVAALTYLSALAHVDTDYLLLSVKMFRSTRGRVHTSTSNARSVVSLGFISINALRDLLMNYSIWHNAWKCLNFET